MNCNDIKNLLADYLGDELESPERTQFESHLSTCAPCRAEVAGLRQVQSELQDAPDISIELADQRSRCLEIRRRRAWPMRTVFAGLRYAAMLAVGLGLGWQLKPVAGDPRTNIPPVRTVATTGVHPAWIEAAARSSAGQSSFARSLAALSTARRKL
ncbi:MAG: zf-HC2 domain-containing protein [Planctomycetes bacterium]|nr:zf-HC2 domain-containing protein [Planctomycetota bacterium]